MTQVFSHAWFRKHQTKLVRFANTTTGRAVFGLPKVPVIGISPAGYSFIRGLDLKNRRLVCECHAGVSDIYARRLRKYGAPFWWVLHFLDWAALDRQQLVPGFGFATLTEHPRSGFYDGYFKMGLNVAMSGFTWAVLRAAIDSVEQSTTTIPLAKLRTGTYADRHAFLTRAGFNFDTSTIPAAASVTGATLAIIGSTATTNELLPWLTGNRNDIVFVPASPGGTTTMQTGYYDNFTATVLGALPYGTWATNYGGLGARNITLAPSGVTKAGTTSLMSMFRGDMLNVPPDGWQADKFQDYVIYSVDYNANAIDLVVDYSYVVMLVNVGDAWKAVSDGDIKVNVGDSWKTVSSLKINIADVWKTVF